MKLFFLFMITFFNAFSYAEIPEFKSTDNTGINKLEKIDGIEKYLIKLSSTLIKIEASVESSAQKLSALEKEVAHIREADIKNLESKLNEKLAVPKTPEMGELIKLQADFTALKNDDLESLRIQVQGLKSSIQLLQSQQGQ